MVEGPRASRPPRASRAVVPLALALLLAACGSRGPLDLGPGLGNGETPDASADVAVDQAAADASDAAADAPGHDAAADAPGEASLIDCGSCVATTCGQDIVACLTDTKCRDVLTCVAQTCLGGGGGSGGFDPQCIFTCANGDTAAIGTLVSIFTCVTQKCGPDCGSVLGGLGGLGGGGFPGGNSPVPNPGQ